jgi:hypothetical protein
MVRQKWQQEVQEAFIIFEFTTVWDLDFKFSISEI